jgi:hypothetical protein
MPKRLHDSVLDGHASRAGAASLVGAAKSGALDGHAGRAGAASLVDAAKSGALG